MRSKLTWLLAVSLVFIISCSNSTKEEYLSNYKAFLADVSANAKPLKTEKDWQSNDKKYNTFSVELKEKFNQELTWQEKLTLTKYDVQYNTIRYENMAKAQLGNAADMIAKAPEKIKAYVEDDIKQNLDIMIEKSKKLKEEAERTVDETIEEIKALHK